MISKKTLLFILFWLTEFFLQICLTKKRCIELGFNGIVKFYCWILIFSETIIFSKSHLWDQTGQLLFNITILRTSYVITKLNCMIQMLQKWIHVQAKCCVSLSLSLTLSLSLLLTSPRSFFLLCSFSFLLYSYRSSFSLSFFISIFTHSFFLFFSLYFFPLIEPNN